MLYSIGDLAAQIDGEIIGDTSIEISGLGTLSGARAGDLSFLSRADHRQYLSTTKASVVLLEQKNLHECPTNAIVVSNPYLAYARLSHLFKAIPPENYERHPSAVVHPDASLANDVVISANVVVEAGATLASGSRIGANSYIGRDCVLGKSVEIFSNVTLYSNVVLGDNCRIHSGAVIGSDGFGFVHDENGKLVEIAQVGGVKIGTDVSIGAATTIDRGAIEDTIIEDGVKIDNQVQIGHNCRIGAHSIICGCVGLVGSTIIGKHCVLAGGVGVGGDGAIRICDGVIVSGMTHVSRSIDKPGTYSGGVLFSETRTWKRNVLRFNRLDELNKRVGVLEKSGKT